MAEAITMRKWLAVPALAFWLLAAYVAEGAAQGLVKVPIAYTTISGQQAIMRVVKDAGMFEKNGLDVTLIYMGTGSAIQALVAKESPIIVASGVQPVNAHLRGADVVVFINLADKLDYIFFGGKSIKEGKDLVGGRVAITRFGALSEFGALYAVKQLGLKPTDVTLVQIGGQPDRFAALEAGAAQATVLQPPVDLMAREAGFRALVDLSEVDFKFLATAIATTRTIIRERPDLIRNFTKAMVDGTHFYKTQKEPSIRSIAAYLKMKDRRLLEQSYNFYAAKHPRSPKPNPESIQSILNYLAERNPQARAEKPERFIDPSHVEQLEKSGYIRKLYGG